MNFKEIQEFQENLETKCHRLWSPIIESLQQWIYFNLPNLIHATQRIEHYSLSKETTWDCNAISDQPVLSHPPLPTCEHIMPTLELPKRHQKYKTTFTTSPKPHHNVRINDSYFPHSFYT